MAHASTFDVVVVGAGVFGAWTAWHLAKREHRVLLVEMYGPAHSRASSGGETRIIRMGYGRDEVYTRWSKQSLVQWKDIFAATGVRLFHRTGVLWLAAEGDVTLEQTRVALQACGVKHEMLAVGDLVRRYPQMNFDGIGRGLLEPESGVLMARCAVNCVVESAAYIGVTTRIAQGIAPRGTGRVESIEIDNGERVTAASFVFACGPWLGKVFPQLLGPRIFPTRQEVFFFGTPPGDLRFAPPALPTWLFQGDEAYGMPDLESRGLKVALDRHGKPIDPDTQSRLASHEGAEWARAYVTRRFPALKDSPIVETRVCQYENTSSGDFLIDRHPDFANVWLVGGGSGHGFKHGPAVGEYTAALILGESTTETRFSLASKSTQQNRAVH